MEMPIINRRESLVRLGIGFFFSRVFCVEGDEVYGVCHDVEKKRMTAMKIPGMSMNPVPFPPKVFTRVRAKIGPRAIPRFPPTEKIDMPVAFFSPVKKKAVLYPSGWKLAIPRPLMMTEKRSRR